MAYDETTAERVRDILALHGDELTERKMFGGIAWMIRGNMACGMLGDDLLVRVDPEDYERALAEPDTRVFDFTGRVARNMVVVSGEQLEGDEALAEWVETGVAYALSLSPKRK
ncbi:MAG TPA: TfoX/Sxy family protein [Solirubrobacterales bacterium]|jgi:TfoX/Sxy family transcriptional regulator of competence genes